MEIIFEWANTKRKFLFTFIRYRQILLTTLEQKQKNKSIFNLLMELFC